MDVYHMVLLPSKEYLVVYSVKYENDGSIVTSGDFESMTRMLHKLQSGCHVKLDLQSTKGDDSQTPMVQQSKYTFKDDDDGDFTPSTNSYVPSSESSEDDEIDSDLESGKPTTPIKRSITPELGRRRLFEDDPEDSTTQVSESEIQSSSCGVGIIEGTSKPVNKIVATVTIRQDVDLFPVRSANGEEYLEGSIIKKEYEKHTCGVLIGYYQSWSTTCTINDINPRLYSHLIYAFAGVENDRIRVIDEYGDIEAGGYKNFNALKERSLHVQTLLAVGGWNEGSKPFSKMVKRAESRETFINSCLSVMKKYGFDGIDLDWEYPCLRGGRASDKKKISKLIKEMSIKFQDRYLLTVAVGAGKDLIESSYDVLEISKYVDLIHLMTYDFHSSTDGTGRVGHNAPLYSTCGRNVIIKCQKTGAWEVEWDRTQKVPYMYKGDQWIGYDDPDSVEKKVKFANNYNLAGIMIYSIDTDDPNGNPSYPLTRAIRDCL